MLMGEVRAEGLLRAIDPVVRASLSDAQEGAIRTAARQDVWQRHPVDIRLALTSPFGRVYLALIAGRERSSTARRTAQRDHQHLASAGNLAVVSILVVTVALAGLAVYGIFAGATLP